MRNPRSLRRHDQGLRLRQPAPGNQEVLRRQLWLRCVHLPDQTLSVPARCTCLFMTPPSHRDTSIASRISCWWVLGRISCWLVQLERMSLP